MQSPLTPLLQRKSNPLTPLQTGLAAHAGLAKPAVTASRPRAPVQPGVAPHPEDYKRIGGGLWIIIAWLYRNDPHKLKEAYVSDHSSFSVVAALLLTISTALAVFGPTNFAVGSSSTVHWVFTAATSLSLAFNVMTILLATEMVIASQQVPAEAFTWCLIENTHKGWAREPSQWAIFSFVALGVSITSCVCLVHGGLHWVMFCVAYAGVIALYVCSFPLRWASVLHSLVYTCKDEVDIKLLNYNAKAFEATALWMWCTKRKPFVLSRAARSSAESDQGPAGASAAAPEGAAGDAGRILAEGWAAHRDDESGGIFTAT